MSRELRYAVPEAFPPEYLVMIRMLANGESQKCVAQALNIAESTLNTRLNKVYSHLGCNNVTQLAHWALNNGLIPNLYRNIKGFRTTK